ncbi:unnamed protein product [Vicia faba]|uniref:RNase H type-1 domain-containing protein n=1 Tax=Vicia faba TaxID=3906 RepID=A0AAV0YJD2_VICFA|nr:unnamed protein product [Vicia faba]
MEETGGCLYSGLRKADSHQRWIISWGGLSKRMLSASNIFLAATKRFESVTNAASAEMLVIRWSLQVAKDIGLESFVVQLDALVVVDNINRIVFNVDLKPLASDCRSLISDFCNVSVMFISRNLNNNIHNLIGISKSLSSRTSTGHILNSDITSCNPAVFFLNETNLP